jgi:hypothetical protein
MSSPTGAHQSPFCLQSDSQQRSPLFNLPLELRYKIYAEIFQPRVYHYDVERGIVEVQHQECEFAIFKECHRSRACSWDFSKTDIHRAPCEEKALEWFHRTCGCSLRGTVRFLRACQQVYVEAQRHFILSVTITLRQEHRFITVLESTEVTQLRSFSQRFLRSSLSGLAPGDCLRRLHLALGEITGDDLFRIVKVINGCKLLLDCLLLEFGSALLPSYCKIEFLYSDFFKAISLLRDVKNVQVTWGQMVYNLVFASDGYEKCTGYFIDARCYSVSLLWPESFRKYLDSVNQQYCDILSRALSELTSRHRKKDRRRFDTLHKEARAIFVVRVQELMEEARLYLSPWGCSNRCSNKSIHQRAIA